MTTISSEYRRFGSTLMSVWSNGRSGSCKYRPSASSRAWGSLGTSFCSMTIRASLPPSPALSVVGKVRRDAGSSLAAAASFAAGAAAIAVAGWGGKRLITNWPSVGAAWYVSTKNVRS